MAVQGKAIGLSESIFTILVLLTANHKARDQKQNYRLKETMSLSGGGLKYVGLSLSPLFGLFDHLNETLESKY